MNPHETDAGLGRSRKRAAIRGRELEIDLPGSRRLPDEHVTAGAAQ
jgi:hypothetical protein